MYVTRTKKHISSFYLDELEDKKAYETLINDPATNVLMKTFYMESETTSDGETSQTTQRPCVRLEYESCSI